MESNSCSVQIIATSHPGFAATKEQFDTFGGHAAGVCYMQDTFDALRAESPERTAKRIKLTKENGHHSVYDHMNITLYLENVPRIIECLLDNERMMTSSIKSGRYTRHALPEREGQLYDKWMDIFKGLIRDKYATGSNSNKFFSESRIEKLAQENSRLLSSAFTLVYMVHTLSYRQLNYVYGFIRDFIAKKTDNDFRNKLKPYLADLLKKLDETGYIDKDLTNNGKNRELSLFNNNVVQEYFGDVYATRYNISYAIYLHTNRHRTLKHWIADVPAPKDLEFYIPEILNDDKKLYKQWLADLDSLRENYPQAMLVDASEMGNLDDFKLKLYERKCSVVMIETMRRTNDTLRKYVSALNAMGRNDLDVYLSGSRCTWKDLYKCPSVCGFADGINEKRKI